MIEKFFYCLSNRPARKPATAFKNGNEIQAGLLCRSLEVQKLKTSRKNVIFCAVLEHSWTRCEMPARNMLDQGAILIGR